jgi:SAM-dependent methyltransferase
MRLTSLVRRGALAVLGALTRRHVILLPRAAADFAATLGVQAPYRIDAKAFALRIDDGREGTLTVTVRGYAGHFPAGIVWQSSPIAHDGPCMYTLDMATGTLWHGVANVSTSGAAIALPGRRFVVDFALATADGSVVRRRTGHYIAGGPKTVDASYFEGDNYVDHEAESAGEHDAIVALLRVHGAGRRVLEVGCATGGLVAALSDSGFDAVGADISAWAVERAEQRLGPNRAWQWDAERDAPPAALTARGPFDTLVMWVTLEHFHHPFKVLAALSGLCAPGARLFIKTTNADSLAHWLHGGDWEGHFDWTHHGVDAVGVKSLRAQLPALGWRIVELSTDQVWDGSADPLHSTVREWYANDARFRALLASRDLGDLVTVVAERA